MVIQSASTQLADGIRPAQKTFAAPAAFIARHQPLPAVSSVFPALCIGPGTEMRARYIYLTRLFKQSYAPMI
jgi:hypothetical protein